MTAVAELVAGQAFASTRPFDALAGFHVPFERLVADASVERRLETVLRRRGRAVVVGRPGSGKSSVLATLLHPPEELGLPTYAPVRLAIGGERAADLLADARELARRVIGDIAASYLTGEDAAALRARGASTVTIAGRATEVTRQLGTRHAHVSKRVRQAAESYSIERASAEVIAALKAALDELVDAELVPVLLLDDADGILSLPGLTAEERTELAEQFFAVGFPPLIKDLDVAVLIAAQPSYERVGAFKHLQRDLIDASVTLPTATEFSEQGVRLLISHAMRVSGVSSPLDTVFDGGAMTTLLKLRYSMETVRQLLSVCRFAVIEADNRGRDVVTEQDIAYGASQALIDG